MHLLLQKIIKTNNNENNFTVVYLKPTTIPTIFYFYDVVIKELGVRETAGRAEVDY